MQNGIIQEHYANNYLGMQTQAATPSLIKSWYEDAFKAKDANTWQYATQAKLCQRHGILLQKII